MSDYMQGDKDNAVSVPFSDDDAEKKPDALLEDDPPTATPEERLTRKQRRQERLQQMLAEGKANADKVRELEERDQKRERELAELRGAVAANQNAIHARAANDNQRDPYEQRLDAVYARQAEAYNAAQAEIAASKFTPERQQHYEKIARDIETEKTRIHTERAVAADRENRRTEQAQQVWVQKYPEVYNNRQAFQYAQATWQRRLALGEQQTNQLVDEVMGETMAQFKLGPKTAPSASDRARLSGIPSAGGGGNKAPGIDFSRDPSLKRIAIAAYPDLPEAEALKKWTNSTGKKLREKKVL